MKIVFEDVRIPAFVGFAMAMWISSFLIAGSIAAMFGAPETHAPLVMTLLFTSIATATVSVLTSSLERGRVSAKSAENRSVSTFIFVNSAGTMVGLITNLSESIERWEPAGPNGLTFIFASMLREDMPLLVYVSLLVPMILAALYLVLKGSALLSAREHPSEDDLARLGAWSGSLLALWIFACMRWQPLSWGAETVATTWTVVLYATMLIFGAWLYGLFGVRVVRWLARAAFELARAATEVLRNPKTWRMVLLTALVTGAVISIVFAAFLLAGMLVAGIGVGLDRRASEEVGGAVHSYIGALLWTLSVLAKGGASISVLLGLGLMSPLLRVLWRGVDSMVSAVRAGVGLKRPPIRGRLSWFVTAFLWGCRAMLRAATARRSAITRVLAVAVPLALVLTASTNGFTVEPQARGRPVVVATPPTSPLEPLASIVPVSITTVSFEPVSLCDIGAGAAEWTYEDDARVSVALSDCRIRTAIGDDEALLVVAMSTKGTSQVDEEARSKRRLDNLMLLASRELGPEAPVYGLDLGMATGSSSHISLSQTFGVSWRERPLLGLLVRSNSDVRDEAVRYIAVELVRGHQMQTQLYSRCSIWKSTSAGDKAADACTSEATTELALAK